VTAAWTVKDSNGEMLADYAAASRLDVGRKVLPGSYDPFRLQVSASYRELFDRALAEALQQRGWEIVRIACRSRGARAAPARVLVAGH
jgi:hypothetical protein